MPEINVPFRHLSAKEYSRQTGLSYNETLLKCKDGTLDAFETDGGQWRIKVYLDDFVDRKDYLKITGENAEMKATIEAMRRLLA